MSQPVEMQSNSFFQFKNTMQNSLYVVLKNLYIPTVVFELSLLFVSQIENHKRTHTQNSYTKIC